MDIILRICKVPQKDQVVLIWMKASPEGSPQLKNVVGLNRPPTKLQQQTVDVVDLTAMQLPQSSDRGRVLWMLAERQGGSSCVGCVVKCSGKPCA